MEYTIKPPRKSKRSKTPKPEASPLWEKLQPTSTPARFDEVCCEKLHCTTTPDHCNKVACIEALRNELKKLMEENIRSSSLLEDRQTEVNKKKFFIESRRDLDWWAVREEPTDVTDSALRLQKARDAKIESPGCSCTACSVRKEQRQGAISSERLVAAEEHLRHLTNWRHTFPTVVVNERDERNEPESNYGGGYSFARTGGYRGYGASAMKPKR